MQSLGVLTLCIFCQARRDFRNGWGRLFKVHALGCALCRARYQRLRQPTFSYCSGSSLSPGQSTVLPVCCSMCACGAEQFCRCGSLHHVRIPFVWRSATCSNISHTGCKCRVCGVHTLRFLGQLWSWVRVRSCANSVLLPLRALSLYTYTDIEED